MKNIIAVISGPLSASAVRVLDRRAHYIAGVELRLDAIAGERDDLARIVRRLRSLRFLGRPPRLVFTWRSPEEGGRPLPSCGRIAALERLLPGLIRRGDLLDVEFRAPDRARMLALARRLGAVPIISFHALGTAGDQSERARRTAPALIAAADRCGGYAKLVAREDCTERAAAFLGAVSARDREPRRATAFTTGATALVSRVAACILGMPLVYAGLERPVMPSQPTVERLCAALEAVGFTRGADAGRRPLRTRSESATSTTSEKLPPRRA